MNHDGSATDMSEMGPRCPAHGRTIGEAEVQVAPLRFANAG